MPIYLTLVILVLVVLFMALTFTIAVTMVGWALRERESEWPTDWSAAADVPHTESNPRAQGEEAERETASGAHSAA
jgi:hypothetical protein